MMDTILDDFVTLLNNKETTELDRIICDTFSEKKDIFSNFSNSLSTDESIQNTMSQIEWDSIEYNPLEIESLIRESLISLERCQVYKEQHRALKKDASAVIEKLYRLKRVLIEDLVDEKNRLSALQPNKTKKHINYANMKGNLQFILDHRTSSHAAQGSAKEHANSDEILVERRRAYSSNEGGEVKKDMRYHIITKEHIIGTHKETGALHDKAAAHGSALADIHRLENEEVTNAQAIINLEKKIVKEKHLFSLVVATYSDGGALDIGEQWELLVSYYRRDYISALKRCAALQIGWKKLFDEDKVFLEQRDSSLQNYLINLRDLKDQFDAIMQRYSRSTLNFPLAKLIQDDIDHQDSSKPYIEIEHTKALSIKDAQILCRGVQLINPNNSNDISASLLPPLTTEKYPSSAVFLTAKPSSAIVAQSENSSSITNVPLEGIWKIKVDGEGWRECFLQYSVIISL